MYSKLSFVKQNLVVVLSSAAITTGSLSCKLRGTQDLAFVQSSGSYECKYDAGEAYAQANEAGWLPMYQVHFKGASTGQNSVLEAAFYSWKDVYRSASEAATTLTGEERKMSWQFSDTEDDANVVIEFAELEGDSNEGLAPIAGPVVSQKLWVYLNPVLGQSGNEKALKSALAHQFGHLLGVSHDQVVATRERMDLPPEYRTIMSPQQRNRMELINETTSVSLPDLESGKKSVFFAYGLRYVETLP